MRRENWMWWKKGRVVMSGKQKTPRIDKDEQELDRKDRALSSPALLPPLRTVQRAWSSFYIAWEKMSSCFKYPFVGLDWQLWNLLLPWFVICDYWYDVCRLAGTLLLTKSHKIVCAQLQLGLMTFSHKHKYAKS